jgi:hypothetical protein
LVLGLTAHASNVFGTHVDWNAREGMRGSVVVVVCVRHEHRDDWALRGELAEERTV